MITLIIRIVVAVMVVYFAAYYLGDHWPWLADNTGLAMLIAAGIAVVTR